jgi:hypothetical protein
MKSVAAIALAACMLLACSLKAAEQTEPENAGEPPKPALQRLVGALSIVEEYAMKDKSGAPFVTRNLVLRGKIDQLVEVNENMGRLDFVAEGRSPLRMTGTVSETGRLALDNPDSNSIVRTRGDSKWTGTPGEYDMYILPSKLGIGDEIHLRFNAPMEGKTNVQSTHANGMVTDMPSAGTEMGLSLLEPNPSDRKPMFKREYGLLPKLGAVPAEPFDKQFHEGIQKYPAMFHLGLVTGPGRNAWTYAGTKVYSKPGSETQWTEKLELNLKLVPR